ncbi:hypothetical protein H6503_04760 [Candidatus Woesearchaeota archaeon]|nr:hypothetical protein [Candidatus Woesearchaeota archaeon]
MASKAKSKAKSADMKVRKKKWVDIVSPAFGDKSIGQTHVFETENALNKTLKINLMSLAGDPRKQSIDIHFKTDKQKGDTAVEATATGYVMQQPNLKKLVRRGKTKIQDSFKCMTSDNMPIIVKIFAITRKNVNNSISASIRSSIKMKLVNRIAKSKFESLLREIIEGKIQKDLKTEVSKIYPMRILEFNCVKLMNVKKGKFETPGEEKPLKKEEEEEDPEDEEVVEEPKEE